MALNQQPEILQVLNGIPHGAMLLDGELRVEEMNWRIEALTGYKVEDVRGVQCDFVVRSNLGAAGRSSFLNVIQRGEPAALQGDLINAGRRVVPVRFTASRIGGRAKKDQGLMLVIEDMTVHSELERKRRGSEKAPKIIGHSPGMQEILELLPVLSHTDASVLVTGETGTGKDLLAEAVHMASKRAAHPFIKVNCGALPEALLESELFGHVRGAFTGAHSDKPGMFRMAQGGTLYLTEIGDLPLQLQVKLLTVLDDMEFYPVGGTKKVKADVRLVAGTHRDLRRLVSGGLFREDLFFRLNVLRAHLPPLRERGEDIPLLMDHFLRGFTNKLGKDIKGLSEEASALLKAYRYPGNVRELRNIIEYAANMCRSQEITAAHLPSYIMAAAALPAEPPSCQADEGRRALPPEAGGMAAPRASSWPEIERGMILEALVKAGGHRGKAAKMLGWGRSTLWRKIKQYALD